MLSLWIPPCNKALIMGILNITPDSSSDGGSFFEIEKAVAHGMELIKQGADILDIGGESTRPGAEPVEAQEELRRVITVIKVLREKTEVPLSIDTSKAIVAEAAVAAGANIINDISALEDPAMGPLAARTGVGLVLMHKQGTPQTMQQEPTYPANDVVTAVIAFLKQACEKALRYGVKKNAIILDPGIGFGKTPEHNFALLRGIPRLADLGAPLLLGHSRKWFLNEVPFDYSPQALQERFIPAIAITALARYHGALLFRVHDPRPHAEALRTVERMIHAHSCPT